MRTYTIQEAIDSVAEALGDGDDRTPTTIRCAINDVLDAADKDGYRVHFDYNQDKAVRAVQRQILARYERQIGATGREIFSE